MYLNYEQLSEHVHEHLYEHLLQTPFTITRLRTEFVPHVPLHEPWRDPRKGVCKGVFDKSGSTSKQAMSLNDRNDFCLEMHGARKLLDTQCNYKME